MENYVDINAWSNLNSLLKISGLKTEGRTGSGEEDGQGRMSLGDWEWDKDYQSYRKNVRAKIIWISEFMGPWVQSAWDGYLTFWDYIIWKLYGANLVKKLPYNRCHLCQSELDPLYLYNLSDVRHKFCNTCYQKECEKMLEDIHLLDFGGGGFDF